MGSWETVDVSLGEDAVLDPQVIDLLRELGERGGENLLGQLAALFNASTADIIASLRGARRDLDEAGLARIAHRLRGSAGALGATRLSRLCAHIEDGDMSDRLLDAVEVEAYRTRAALDALEVSG
jgi:HPt (histidine-containing phosphotransfer) domain-containing protein